jgi:hypothetical protein
MTLAKTPRYWETVTHNIALLDQWGEDFSIRHLVMPNHVECCTYPVLDWIAQRVPAAPVNVMAQFHPDNFCGPESGKYREKYADIARRPVPAELDHSWGPGAQAWSPLRDRYIRASPRVQHAIDARDVTVVVRCGVLHLHRCLVFEGETNAFILAPHQVLLVCHLSPLTDNRARARVARRAEMIQSSERSRA